MVFLSQNYNEINNEVSSLLRIIRSQYQNEIKIQIMNASSIREFKLKVLRKTDGFYKFMFLVKIPEDYPSEPLWTEPVIICREMLENFTMDEFKSYKLRPLVDNVLNFCHKYDFIDVRSAVITFPSMRIFSDDRVALKVFFLLNRELMKTTNPKYNILRRSLKPKQNSRSKYEGNIGFYNDMAINLKNYVDMFDKIQNKSKKFLFARKHSNELINGKSGMIRSNIRKAIPDEPIQMIKILYVRRIKDIKHCQLNHLKAKRLIAHFLMIPSRIENFDYSDYYTMEIGGNFRVKLKRISDPLSIWQNLSNDFINFVNSTFIQSESGPLTNRNHGTFTLLPLHSRQIISMNAHYESLKHLLLYFNCGQYHKYMKKSIDEKEVVALINLDLKMNMYQPIVLKISFEIIGFIVESEVEMEIDSSDLVCDTFKILEPRESSFIAMINSDIVTLKQPFIEEKSFDSVILFGGDEPDHITVSPHSHVNMPNKFSEIITEIISYPTNSSNSSEYTLNLNPKDDRHRSILESIGLLHYKHSFQTEIVASTDYDLEYFFVKEVVSRNDEVNIRLHKLPLGSLIFNIVKEENEYFKSLSVSNRKIWCTPRSSDLGVQLVSSMYNIVRMFIDKLSRRRRIHEEALKLNCTHLTISRFHFYKEFIDSISTFGKSV